MIIPNNNLVAIAYKTGFCGSLMYYILAHSKETAKYTKLPPPEFSDGTSHWGVELWFAKPHNELHHYHDSFSISEHDWASYQSAKSIKALNSKKLVLFRCHPNVAYCLRFIENLKVLYISSKVPIQFERWGYQKEFLPLGEQWFIREFKKYFKTTKVPSVIDARLKRKFIVKYLNHQSTSFETLQETFKQNFFNLEIDKILNQDYNFYLSLCDFLQISPIKEKKFNLIISNYLKKQWKRF